MPPINTTVTPRALEHDCAGWPGPLRARWLAAHEPETGLGWARETQYTYARVFSRYLATLDRLDLPSHGCVVHPEGLRAFVREAQRSACPRTVHGYVHQLLLVATLLYPDEARAGRLDWLYATRERIAAAAVTTPKQRRSKIVGALDILGAGAELIGQARAQPAGETAFVQFRTGLFLLLGLNVPERRRALATLRLEQIDLDAATIAFEPTQIKIREGRVRALPAPLVALLGEWLAIRRVRGIAEAGPLFVGANGRAVGAAALYAALRTQTGAVLGRPVTPHLLRHAAATAVLELAPAQALLASLVLGQRSRRTTAEYTETARMIAASRHAAEAIAQAGQAAARTVRTATASRPAFRRRRLRPPR